MIAIVFLFIRMLCDCFKSRRLLETENPDSARAATDLGRLWLKQGKRAEALDVLSSIYGRFSEGFNTRDLKEANAVLAQLQ